jgi:xylulokinase
MQTAGGALDWFERLLRAAGEDQVGYAELDAAAAELPPGGDGLLFLPYLLGERSPHWNPAARGAFVGLAMPHGRGALARAVMEGVAFNLRHILEVLVAQGVAVDSMRLIGGAGQSELWRQILADIYGLPIAQVDLPAQATALGAAIAGGVGVGIYPDYGVAHDLAPVAHVDRPDPAAHARYAPLYDLFKDTYLALEPIFASLAQQP